MAERSAENAAVGMITAEIEKGTLPQRTIAFVHRQLPVWRDDPNRRDEESENPLNLHLCKFLNSRARRDFPMVCFSREEYQGSRRSVDLSASPAEPTVLEATLHSIYDPIVVFECKRIPPPARDRERE